MQRNWDVILYRSSLDGDENILKLIVVMVTQSVNILKTITLHGCMAKLFKLNKLIM